jgi:uncharacterized protein YjeT (DUF2065 family)
MNPLVIAALVMAAVILLLSLPLVASPGSVAPALAGFPRCRVAAGILTAASLFWAAMIVYNADLGRFDSLKPGIMLGAVVLFFLVFFLMDELLASRALGGLLMLVATPILNAARFHASGFRLVPVVLAYVIVVAGMALVLNPYLFRKAVERIGPSPARWRAIGGGGIALSVVLLALALLVY